jgi:hypothetical protein
MVIKYTKVFDPGADSSISIQTTRFFLLSNAMTLAFEHEKQYGSSSLGGDQGYQVVWS